MAEKRDFPSLSAVQDFCFQYFSNISCVAAIAIELESIVLNSSRMGYCTIDGHLCVTKIKILKSKQKKMYDVSDKNITHNNQRTAYDLSRSLGLARDVSDVMSSPQQMLLEIRNETVEKNDNDIELSVENDLEIDLKNILSMAMAGAESYETQTAELALEGGIGIY
jgi:hypothetical protein